MSATLAITQLVTIGIGLAVELFAQNLPRKPIFLVVFFGASGTRALALGY
jgi:hypothetical protein